MSDFMKEKVCIVTGANSGIGKATALGLANLGAMVIMLCRDKSRGELAMSDIIAKSGNESINLFLADLSSQQSIRQFVSDFKKRYDKLHVLINNAGVNLSKRYETVDGLERSFAINALAPFLLMNLLRDILINSAPSRIVNVASSMQRKTINFDDLQFENHYPSWKVYSHSKAAVVLLTYEFARQLSGTGVTVNCLHPGAVKTNILRDYKRVIKFFAKLFLNFAKSPEKGAETSIFLASSPDLENTSGKYFKNKKEAKSKEITYDESIAKRLWDICANLTKLDKY